MAFADYPEVLQGALYVWASFRKMGFSADQIFLRVTNEDLFIDLHARGHELGTRLGTYQIPASDIVGLWRRLAEEWNARIIPDSDVRSFGDRPDVRKAMLDLLTNLTKLGILTKAVEWN